MTTAWRRVAICVDDFGLNAAVNDGAWRLAEQGRVCTLACLSTAPAWAEAAQRLRGPGGARLEAGLHLNLTEAFGPGVWRRGLGGLILSAYSIGLPLRRLREEIATQLDAFEQARGAAPSFVDGHQHVHQLPGVRETLLQELQRRYPTQLPWLRDTRPPRRRQGGQAQAFKPRLIAALGATRLAALARDGGFAQNHGMLGVYDFSGTPQAYAERLHDWCVGLTDGGLLICHAASALAPGDPIAAARVREFEVLGSEGFGRLLREQRLSVGRLSEVLRGAEA
ncbi:MAG TPA: ChbG/HpnK family deacetylase [Roseateles sp.]